MLYRGLAARRAAREHDRARELLEVAIGIGGLVHEFAGWAARRALWALTPSPVREWINWQGGDARWSVK